MNLYPRIVTAVRDVQILLQGDSNMETKQAETATTVRVVKAVWELQAALKAAYGPDNAYMILGRGRKIACSNLQDGLIEPWTDNRKVG
jgi:hypothetical protein